MASALVCSALPITTCPTSASGMPAAQSAPLAANTPRSVAVKAFSAPPKAPLPVRLAERKTTSVSLPCVAICSESGSALIGPETKARQYDWWCGPGQATARGSHRPRPDRSAPSPAPRPSFERRAGDEEADPRPERAEDRLVRDLGARTRGSVLHADRLQILPAHAMMAKRK